MELNDILTIAIKGNASDIHLKAGLPPLFRVDGALVPLKNGERLTPEQLHGIATSIMTPGQKSHFDKFHEVDLAYSIAGLGRFRVNAFMQRGTVGIVFRVIPFGVKTIEQLVLPKVVERVAMEPRGLILVTGTTGSGKSTTLAAMIDYINTNRTCHIITIEDPIEFLIRDKRSIVNQREIGVDTNSFATALRAALRKRPDQRLCRLVLRLAGGMHEQPRRITKVVQHGDHGVYRRPRDARFHLERRGRGRSGSLLAREEPVGQLRERFQAQEIPIGASDEGPGHHAIYLREDERVPGSPAHAFPLSMNDRAALRNAAVSFGSFESRSRSAFVRASRSASRRCRSAARADALSAAFFFRTSE